MLKIRLEGTKEQIEEFLAGFRPAYKILSESAPYANRGKSAYFRVYLDVEFSSAFGEYCQAQFLKECREVKNGKSFGKDG